jgi:hypothetical protein
MTQPASSFADVDERLVFDNGITKAWAVSGMAWWRIDGKVVFGLRNASGDQHGQAPPAWIEMLGIAR